MNAISVARTVRNSALVLAVAVAGLPLMVNAAPATRPTTGAADAKASSKKLSVDQFAAAREAKGTVVLDVRSPEEFAAGHVPGAVNVPVAGKGAEAFDKAVEGVDRTTPILVHCRSGVRSAKAMDKLRKMGFADLSDFPGGWVAWSEAGKPADVGSKSGELPNPKK